MSICKTVAHLFLFVCLMVAAQAQQKLSADGQFLFKKAKTKLSIAEKTHLFEQLDIRWSENKKQFVDKDDVVEATPYLQANFFPTDINNDGTEEIFIVLVNAALFDGAGAKIILFTKDADGSYQKNTEIPAEDIVPLTRKHLGYPDILLSSSEQTFIIWRWNGKIYKYFQKVSGQQLPDGPNKGLEDISNAYQGSLKQ
ncbi:MAG: hypothetical protein ABJB86_22010 [Bacteroidota bacterium]